MLKLPRNKLFWALVLPLLVLNCWAVTVIYGYFGSLIGVVIIATLLSFLLDYPVRFLAKYKINRDRAVLLVFLVALLLLIAVSLIFIPLILDQLNALVSGIPNWIKSSNNQLKELEEWTISQKIPVNITNLITQILEKISTQLQLVSGQILSFVVDTFSRMLDVFLTIVLTFYMLLHGDRLWNDIFQWLPANIRPRITHLLRQNFQNYFLGQSILALVMGIAMTIGLIILVTPFGLLFGLTIGVMTLFPFGASLSLTTISLLLCVQDFWLGLKVFVVTLLIDQTIENFLAPRILGNFTGLNPVWILLSLMVGLKIAGVLGLLLAVPIAGFIKSLLTTDNIHTN